MKNALIIVDVQNWAITKHTRNLPKKIAGLVSKRKFGEIIFLKFKNSPKSSFVRHLGWRGAMKSPETNMVDELKKFATKDNTFTRTAYSGFFSKKFGKFLKSRKVKHLYLAGIDTENCVLTTARAVFDRGYKVTVLKSYCGSSANPRLGRAALEIIRENIGEVK